MDRFALGNEGRRNRERSLQQLNAPVVLGRDTCCRPSPNTIVIPQTMIRIEIASALRIISFFPQSGLSMLISSFSLSRCVAIAIGMVLMGNDAISQDTAPSRSLAGTAALDIQGDIASELVAGVDRFLLKELGKSVEKRINFWPKPESTDGNAARDSAYESATATLRQELRMRIGMIDSPIPCESFASQSVVSAEEKEPKWLADNNVCVVHEVRWQVFDGVDASGLMVIPHSGAKFHAVLVPDAGQNPEQLCGFDESSSKVALELAARGGVVVIPNVIGRHREARNGRAKLTDQEFLYRSAFVLGRHVIGYQVQEISSAFAALQKTFGAHPNLVVGWGEGGCLALYAAAVDTGIHVACVSGHFGPREQMWSEPIHRNVHGLLNRFGDAQLAALIAPRTLVIDAVTGPKVDIAGEGGAPGTLLGPFVEQVEIEWERTTKILQPWQLHTRIQLVKPTELNAQQNQTTLAAIERSLAAIGIEELKREKSEVRPLDWKRRFVSSEIARRQETLAKWNRFQQSILERCSAERAQYWNKLDTKSPDSFADTIKPYRDYFRDETIGDWGWDSVALNPRTRLIYDDPKWIGYEVVLDVQDEVFAFGTLLMPRDGQPLKKRPCVVFQHGLEGRPSDTVLGDHPAYHDVSRQLVEQGYVVFAPQNLYLFQDRFRTLQRKSNPLGKTLFSTIVAQHRQIIRWLGQREEIDPKKIAFYGLSYGGKSAMRIPALVPEYCLSICSADFNDWVWKNASTTSPYSYVWTNEYEIFEFGLGNHFNYAEMAALIAPRPFMVERGHDDGVAPDERVGLEFAKVNRLYSAKLGLADKCQIEWFVGPHTIHGKGTFDFLKKHLR